MPTRMAPPSTASDLPEVLHRRHGCHGAAGVGHQRAAEIREVYVLADAVKQRHPQFLPNWRIWTLTADWE